MNAKALLDSVTFGAKSTVDIFWQEKGRVGRERGTAAQSVLLVQQSKITLAKKFLKAPLSMQPKTSRKSSKKPETMDQFDFMLKLDSMNSDGFRWKSAERMTVCTSENHSNTPETVGICWNSWKPVEKGQRKSSDIRRKPVGGIEIPVSATGSQWKHSARQWQPPSANAVQCRWAGCYLRVYYWKSASFRGIARISASSPPPACFGECVLAIPFLQIPLLPDPLSPAPARSMPGAVHFPRRSENLAPILWVDMYSSLSTTPSASTIGPTRRGVDATLDIRGMQQWKRRALGPRTLRQEHTAPILSTLPLPVAYL
ncbi:hypothetical protein DFH08DRAFT_799672 [Mycena albidolilacea]|uniref:Uncharacterized protein n=1 Tax=Mycena albidolilacea TaxID=1033008 RepID=A0AAD7AMR1_9AGAR|nr:hypothetical protein DFH08DRAFT_799672 [Mycena albidolilacea]